jgi:uncharacterized repeat protein (TIGR03943 family)
MIPARFARAGVLGAWAAFFTVVWFSGDTSRYLGERTMWVVPFGAVATGLAAIGLLLRPTANDRPVQGPEALGIVVMLVPVLAVLAVPNAQLGASAAERRAIDPSATARLAASNDNPGPGLSYAYIMAAQDRPQPGVEPGTPVRLVGFVMRRPGTPDTMFQIARFFITCCVADATVLYATVDPPAEAPPRNTWLDLTGTLARRNGQLIVQAEQLRRIAPPQHPYLSASGAATALPPVSGGTAPPDPKTAKPPAPYRAPKPPATTHTFPARSITNAGITVAVSKVEFAKTETRVFTTITNRSGATVTIFASPAVIGDTSKAVSGNDTYTTTTNTPSYLPPRAVLRNKATTTGVITFPKMNPYRPLRVFIACLSENADIGRNGNIELELAWRAIGTPAG